MEGIGGNLVGVVVVFFIEFDIVVVVFDGVNNVVMIAIGKIFWMVFLITICK